MENVEYRRVYEDYYGKFSDRITRRATGPGLLERHQVISQLTPIGIILEVGCGVGALLSKLGGWRIGIDVSSKILGQAKKLWPELDLVVASATNLPFRRHLFHAIIASEVIEHLNQKDAKAFVSETSAVLKDGSRLVVSTPNRKSLWNCSMLTKIANMMGTNHVVLYSPDQLSELVAEDLQVESCRFGNEVEFGPRFAWLSNFATWVSFVLGKLGLRSLLNSRTYLVAIKKRPSLLEFWNQF